MTDTDSLTLDTRSAVESPEGINLLLRAAGPLPRALAFTIDLLIRTLLIGLLSIVLVWFGRFGIGLLLISIFIVNWWYMVLFEVLKQGQSPGKKAMGLRVIHDDGTPIGWSASLVRNLLRFVDGLPIGYVVGFVSCCANPAFKRLGDLAAGTLVVYQDTQPTRPTLPEITACPIPFALSRQEQRAILGFTERSGYLSKERRQELAALLSDVLETSADEAETRLHGIAKTLVGSA